MRTFKYFSLIFLVSCFVQNIFSVQITEENQTYWNQFQKFIIEHEKEYSSEIEIEIKFQNFKENIKIIEEMNKNRQQHEIVYGINQHHDLTHTEFSKKILMPPRQATIFESSKYRKINKIYDEDIPINWNWVDHGAVTPVQDQGSVGTCWSFSTAENIEGVWFLAGNELVQLSEQQLVECDSLINPPDADCGVFGGWPYLGLSYIIDVGGIASNEDYRYCVGVKNKDDPCYPCSAPGYDEKLCGPGIFPPSCNQEKWHCKENQVKKVAKISNWEALSSDEETLKKQLYENGPISIALNAHGLFWYKSGVYSPKNCDPTDLDHAVLLVGYGVDEESGLDYWTVKNSWGEKWGEEGYFRIERGVGKCGVNAQPVTGVVGKENTHTQNQQEILQ